MTDNETWETCPECGRYRKVDTTPGILHRTRICDICFGDVELMRRRAEALDEEGMPDD